MPSPSPYHHGDLRRALVTAALEILEGEAVAALTLSAVAARAGVSANAPYRHYPNKASLLAAVATRGFEHLHEVVLAADTGAKRDKAVSAQGIAYVRFAIDHPALFRLMFGPVGVSTPELEAAGRAAYEVLLDRVATFASNDKVAAVRALGYWSLMHGFATLSIDGRVTDKGDPESVIAQLLQPPRERP